MRARSVTFFSSLTRHAFSCFISTSATLLHTFPTDNGSAAAADDVVLLSVPFACAAPAVSVVTISGETESSCSCSDSNASSAECKMSDYQTTVLSRNARTRSRIDTVKSSSSTAGSTAVSSSAEGRLIHSPG